MKSTKLALIPILLLISAKIADRTPVEATDVRPMFDEQSAPASIQHLANAMDQFHNRFPVYDDVSSAGNHFHMLAKFPNQFALVTINGSYSLNKHSGATAIRCTFTPGGGNFGGYNFQNGILPNGAIAPVPNFGTVPNAGYDLTGATTLTFWARGEQGGEVLDFFMGGVGWDGTTRISPFPDSTSAVKITVALTTQWTQYTIDLAGEDISYVLGGFGWGVNGALNPGGAVFYVDDIQYNLSPAWHVFAALGANPYYQTFAAPTCDNSILPTSQVFSSGGGSGSFNVTAGFGCAWQAVPLPNWVTITSGGSGSGPGTVNFSVAPNPGPNRNDIINAAGKVFFVIQDSGCPTITVNPAALPNGAIGATYGQTFTQTGGNGAITWSVSAGTLPAGLNLSAVGVLSGTPCAGGAFNFTVRATDTNGCFGERAYTLIISGGELQYYPLPFPVRLLETRPGQQGCFTPGAPLGANEVRMQQATGPCTGIPANARAIVGNATVVNFASTGFHWITLYPSDAQRPNASNLNFSDNQIVPNAFWVGLSNDGKFNIYSHGATHFIVDLTGYFAP